MAMFLDYNVESLYYERICFRPGACIYVTPRLNAIIIVNYLTGDTVAIKMHFQGENGTDMIIISSSYLPFGKHDLLSSEAKVFMGYCSQKEHKLVCGCDANAHHIVWESTDSNKQRDDLLESISIYNLCILSKGNEPTFITKNRRDVLDITFCSKNCYDIIRYRRV